MAGPMEGYKVVELGVWVAGPSAAGILGDWGADVVKIEPRNGDPFRGLMAGFGSDTNPPFELDNRNKRSVTLDLSTSGGREAAAKLVDGADVFVTNVRPGAVRRAGLDYDTVSARNPRLVYAAITGYGLEGEDADRAAYDVGAFWSRAGVAASLTPEGADPPYQRGGMGDHMAGLAAAGGVCAALVSRAQTGRGQLVSTSLLRIGMYMIGWDVNTNLRTGVPTVAMSRSAPPNPLINAYTAGDGRRFWMLGLQGDRHWPDVVRAVERPEWLEDERFANLIQRFANSAELVRELDAIFAGRPLVEWEAIFDREDVWWAPLQASHEAVLDPQVRSSGALIEVPSEDGPIPMVAGPVDFGSTPWSARSMPPELGQHTEEVLLELGYTWDDIIGMKEAGAIL
ncbi:MAG: CaiB/BaiF CoA transferase family protein [Acidimicrobiales bacterium]